MQIQLALVGICLIANSVASNAFLDLKRRDVSREPWSPEAFDETGVVTEEFITQRLDNFDPQNNRTFQMRYYKNEQHAKEGGPILIYLGGEWVISKKKLLKSHLKNIAEEMGGLLIYTEHRFYGKSRPTPTLETENLKYLSIDQALADVAHFITEIKKNPKYSNSPVVVSGGSYSATMAAWFRQKYPHLAVGAWASSAPVLAQLDFKEYKEIMGQSIGIVAGNTCLDAVQGSFGLTEELIEKREFQRLRETFHLCDDFNSTDILNVWNFFFEMTDIFADIIQKNKQQVLRSFCTMITASNSTESRSTLSFFADFIRSKYPLVSKDEKCLRANYADTVNSFKNIDPHFNSSMRQWTYQTCSEFGWFQTSTSGDQPFGSNFPLPFFTKLCEDLFGQGFSVSNTTENILRKNTLYGGMNPAVTNVIFTQGQLDPWRMMGIQRDHNKNSPAIVIPGESHCGDQGPVDFQENSRDLIYAKIAIRNSIYGWVREAQQNFDQITT